MMNDQLPDHITRENFYKYISDKDELDSYINALAAKTMMVLNQIVYECSNTDKLFKDKMVPIKSEYDISKIILEDFITLLQKQYDFITKGAEVNLKFLDQMMTDLYNKKEPDMDAIMKGFGIQEENERSN